MKALCFIILPIAILGILIIVDYCLSSKRNKNRIVLKQPRLVKTVKVDVLDFLTVGIFLIDKRIVNKAKLKNVRLRPTVIKCAKKELAFVFINLDDGKIYRNPSVVNETPVIIYKYKELDLKLFNMLRFYDRFYIENDCS